MIQSSGDETCYLLINGITEFFPTVIFVALTDILFSHDYLSLKKVSSALAMAALSLSPYLTALSIEDYSAFCAIIVYLD